MKAPKEPDLPTLALFDFDGTLTTKDSFLAFLLFTHGRKKLAVHLLYLWPVLLLYRLKLISNSAAKQFIFKRLYKNWAAGLFQAKATVFCSEILPQLLNPLAMAKFNWHRQQGHKVVVVTAMFREVLETWARKAEVELLATELEIKNGRLTGAFASPNCFGPEKAERVKKAGLLAQNPVVYAYGDSEGDKELLALANWPFFRKF